MSEKIDAQVKDMATLTLLTNKINPIQEKNLKLYPLIFFNGVKTVNIKYDLSSNKTEEDGPAMNDSYMVYDLEIDATQENEKLDVRFKHLETAVRQLFWNNIRIKLRFNGQVVQESVKNGK